MSHMMVRDVWLPNNIKIAKLSAQPLLLHRCLAAECMIVLQLLPAVQLALLACLLCKIAM
jgi:hypothetical protein